MEVAGRLQRGRRVKVACGSCETLGGTCDDWRCMLSAKRKGLIRVASMAKQRIHEVLFERQWARCLARDKMRAKFLVDLYSNVSISSRISLSPYELLDLSDECQIEETSILNWFLQPNSQPGGAKE